MILSPAVPIALAPDWAPDLPLAAAAAPTGAVVARGVRPATGQAAGDGPGRLPAPQRSRGTFRPPARSLPVLLNHEWERLCASPDGTAAAARWAAGPDWPTSADRHLADGLDGIVRYVQEGVRTVAERDAVLLQLLHLCRGGDGLAGRVVLQVMLPKVIRLARSLAYHPDWTDGLDEAQATVLASLWELIANYPLERRPGQVTGNLALDLLAMSQRGHTGSSWRIRPVREEPYDDVLLLTNAGQVDLGPDDPAGPADAELCIFLAWAVRTKVLQLQEAHLLWRVYSPSEPPGAVPTSDAVAAELGLTGVALRQRCHRLARRLRAAATAAEVGGTTATVRSVLQAA